MKKKYLIFSIGLAMFSMFFGSGNLVFPLMVGNGSQGNVPFASLGILLTGVLVPFLGILALFLFRGDSRGFFGMLGKRATFWFPLLALSLMGPFGVLGRCITVAHGAFKLLLPLTPLWVFSGVSCVFLLILCLQKNRIVPVLGSILTPILLLSLVAIAVFGVMGAPLPDMAPASAWPSFKEGLFQGYQTMDLLAAFFFSSFVIKHIQDKFKDSCEEPKKQLSLFLKAASIGALCLSLVYIALVLLGAMYRDLFQGAPPEEFLGILAKESLGSLAGPVVASAVILACLTTAVVLTSLFSDFLKKEIAKGKISNAVSLTITLAIAFCTSNLRFSGIAKVIGPILEMIYPALIALTVAAIFNKLWGWKAVRIPFFIALVLKLIAI